MDERADMLKSGIALELALNEEQKAIIQGSEKVGVYVTADATDLGTRKFVQNIGTSDYGTTMSDFLKLFSLL